MGALVCQQKNAVGSGQQVGAVAGGQAGGVQHARSMDVMHHTGWHAPSVCVKERQCGQEGCACNSLITMLRNQDIDRDLHAGNPLAVLIIKCCTRRIKWMDMKQ
jgi:hypothetical protein